MRICYLVTASAIILAALAEIPNGHAEILSTHSVEASNFVEQIMRQRNNQSKLSGAEYGAIHSRCLRDSDPRNEILDTEKFRACVLGGNNSRPSSRNQAAPAASPSDPGLQAWKRKCATNWAYNEPELRNKYKRIIDYFTACYGMYDRRNPGASEKQARADGILIDNSKDASAKKQPVEKTQKVITKRQIVKREGMDIDPRTQQPCVTMTPIQPFPDSHHYSSGATTLAYKYEIKNTCPKGYMVHPETNAGWKGLTEVGPNRASTWFCTDGYKGQRDCKGGANGYTFK